MSDETHYIGGPLHVCTDCHVPHYDNCTACFGFGVMSGTLHGMAVPIAAYTAAHEPPADAQPCPVCRSTTAGLPVETA